MTYYSRKTEMPKTNREGLANFVQMIINRLEAGEAQEALLTAVDLLQDVESGFYDEAAEQKIAEAMRAEMEKATDQRNREIVEAAERGRLQGIAEEKARMAKALGLAA